MFCLKNKGSLNTVKSFLPTIGHYELTRSIAADDYVWKEDTSLGERFEYGKKKVKRNSSKDWDEIKENAKCGRLDSIPSDVYVRYFASLTRIAAAHHEPVGVTKRVHVLWGCTGTGKSHRAWEQFPKAYSKDPRTKWWTGYRGQDAVIIDEFRGGIDIAHILRWTDKYPVSVETKGSHIPLECKTVLFTSNIRPECWYPEVDSMTLQALMRRLIVHEVLNQNDEINLS